MAWNYGEGHASGEKIVKKTWHFYFQITVLILSGLFLVAYSLLFTGEGVFGVSPKNSGKNAIALETNELEKTKKEILAPKEWISKTKHRLFLSEKYLYFPDKNEIKKEDDKVMVGPFPLGWLQKYDLPIMDLTVATQDPDGDGFTNIMEYHPEKPEEGTNPIDPQSHPSYISALRLKEVKTTKIEYKFTSTQKLEGKDVYSVIVEKGEDRNSFMRKQGEKVEGFEIVGFTPKRMVKKSASTGAEEEVDVSELEVENKELEMKTIFVQGEGKNIPEIHATFVLALANKIDQPFAAERGRSFDLMGEKYRIIDASGVGVKVKKVDSTEEYLIPNLSSEDLKRLPPKVEKK